MTIAQTAARLLEKEGDAVVMSYATAGDINPATGEGTPGATVTLEGFGYPGAYKAQDVDGTNIQAGDIRLTLQRLAERPQVGWIAEIDGQTYRVMNVRTVRKAGADVITICQLRRQ